MSSKQKWSMIAVVVLVIISFFAPWLPREFDPGLEDNGSVCARKKTAIGYWFPFGRMFTTCRGDTFYMLFWGSKVKIFEGDGSGRHLNT